MKLTRWFRRRQSQSLDAHTEEALAMLRAGEALWIAENIERLEMFANHPARGGGAR